MIITVDSNILISVFSKDSLYRKSAALLEKYCSHEYIINDCIYLELGIHFSNLKALGVALNTLEIRLIEEYERNYNETLNAWNNYLKKKKFVCPSCGKVINPICSNCKQRLSFRQRILTDFLIAGFASANSNGIITLDPTYYRNYFPQLIIFETN
ncbi:MAG: hypothetical protein JRE20_11175 [Deltaproteobacteria bacterium]|nr:hypothetical protein [Deltaproteobacteria bacterium]